MLNGKRDAWDADALLGAQLGGCVIQRTLAVGGKGAVYLARQARPKRLVAIKVVRPQCGCSGDTSAPPGQVLAFLQREADAAAALDHRAIVPIYAFGEEQEVAYLVMPYLPDGSLTDLLARQGPCSLEQMVRTIEQAAAALDYVHARRLVHRNVKPSNMLLHPDGRVLLADFGLAHAVSPAAVDASDASDAPALDRSGAPPGGDEHTGDRQEEERRPATDSAPGDLVLGTPGYMAPEQVLNAAPSAATDIYALGAVAYTLLAGYPPFVERGVASLLRRQLTEPPPPLPCPEVPPAVEVAIAWALAKAPAERPGSAGAFAHALRMAVGLPDDAPPRLLGSEERVLEEWTGDGVPRATSSRLDDAPVEAVDADAPTEPVPCLQRPAALPRWPGGAEADDRVRRLGRSAVWKALAAGMAGLGLVAAVLAGGGLLRLARSAGVAGPDGGRSSVAPSPTASRPVPGVALSLAPEALVLTASQQGGHKGHDAQACSATQTISNLSGQTVGWAWQPPFMDSLQVQVNGGDPTPSPEDMSPGLAPGASDTLSMQTTCTSQDQSFTIDMTDTLGNHYAFTLVVQGNGGSGGGNGDGG
jgi:serine/threonine protein kinase